MRLKAAKILLASVWQERLVEATKSKEQGNARFKAPKDLCSGRTYFLLELPLAKCQVGSFKDAICAYLDAIYFLGYEA